MRPAKRRSRASTRRRWRPRSPPTAIATRWCCPRPKSSRAWCAALAKPGDYVICLGAGIITQWAYALPGELARSTRPDAPPMPGLVGEVKALAPNLRGRLAADAPLATRPGFASAARPRRCSPRRTKTISPISCRLCRARSRSRRIGARLEPHRPRRRRARRRHPARRPGVRRGRDRWTARASSPAPRRRTSMSRKAAAKAGVDGLAFLRGVPGSIGGALGHERRRAWRRDQGRAGRGARRRPVGREARAFERRRWAFPIATARRRTTSSSRSAVFQGRPGEPAAIEAEMERITARARSLAADPRKDRRLDIQEPAGHEGLAADRQGRLPRACASAAPRCRPCTATS